MMIIIKEQIIHRFHIISMKGEWFHIYFEESRKNGLSIGTGMIF